MADPPCSSSSESEDEQNRQFSNDFDDDEDATGADILHHPPSDSESDTEVEPHSIYNIMKPFHIPGMSSGITTSSDAAPQSGLDSQLSEFSIIDKVAQSVESPESQVGETEETDDKIVMEDTDVGPSLTIDLEVQEIPNLADQSTEEHNEKIETMKGDHLDKDANAEQTDMKPQPPPKPVFKVANNRALIFSIRENSESQSIISTENVDTNKEIDAKVDMETDSDEECEKETFSKSSEAYNMSDDDAAKEHLIVTEAESTEQQTEDGQIDNEHIKDQPENETDIITDSMVADITYKDEVDLRTSLTGMESFAVVGINEEDEDEFGTPKEHMSDVEELEEGKSPDPVTPDYEPTSATSSSSGFDKSFVVIGTGSFKDSGHGYKSISSSISENELTKSGERFPSENENCEEGESDKSDSTLPLRDRIKLFEEASKEKPNKTVKKMEETNVTDRNSPTKDSGEEREQMEIFHEQESTEDIKLTSHDSEDARSSGINVAEEIITERDVDDQPPVPPKSDAVLESLRSIHQELYSTHEEQRFSERVSETQERFHTYKSESDIHSEEQETQRMDCATGQSTVQGPASMPHSQSNPVFTSNQWGYFQQYSPGYYAGNQPYSYDPEMYQRLANDPYFIQLMQYQQYMLQQQMFPGQVPNVNQSANFANDSDSYHTASTETLQGQAYGPEPRSVPTVTTQQRFQAENIQAKVEAPHSYGSHADRVSQQQEASESLSTLKEDEPISREAEHRKDSPGHSTEEKKDTHIHPGVQRRIKQQGNVIVKNVNELPHDQTNKMTECPEKTDQPGHPPSLIRVFAMHSVGS